MQFFMFIISMNFSVIVNIQLHEKCSKISGIPRIELLFVKNQRYEKKNTYKDYLLYVFLINLNNI